jgi:hypothetical protein
MLEILGVAGKQEQSTILHTKEPISSWKYCAYKTPVVFNNIKLEKKLQRQGRNRIHSTEYPIGEKQHLRKIFAELMQSS